MTAPFVIDLGFTRNEYAAIVKGVGLGALLLGGFAGGFIARALPLATSLVDRGVLQAVANLSFSALAMVGTDTTMLAAAIIAENFTSAIGTVMFVAYLSALCQNAAYGDAVRALTALAAVGRTYFCPRAPVSSPSRPVGSGFVICMLAGIPACCCWPGCRNADISNGWRREEPDLAAEARTAFAA